MTLHYNEPPGDFELPYRGKRYVLYGKTDGGDWIVRQVNSTRAITISARHVNRHWNAEVNRRNRVIPTAPPLPPAITVGDLERIRAGTIDQINAHELWAFASPEQIKAVELEFTRRGWVTPKLTAYSAEDALGVMVDVALARYTELKRLYELAGRQAQALGRFIELLAQLDDMRIWDVGNSGDIAALVRDERDFLRRLFLIPQEFETEG